MVLLGLCMCLQPIVKFPLNLRCYRRWVAAKWSNSTICRERERLQSVLVARNTLTPAKVGSGGLQLTQQRHQLPSLTSKQINGKDI